ncbi:MAG: hypothetical protein HGA54_09440, partial [Actinobacteria bacterium]|nr:hypothetical protein [Actinomycetota bacterium]
MSNELFTLRAATKEDIPSIVAMAYAEGMGTLEDYERVTVAVNGAGEVVGFIRILEADDVHYVNPVVTYPSWRSE